MVFDFIREDVAEEILKGQILKITQNLQSEKDIQIILSDAAMETLKNKANSNLENGGRGIGNIVESLLIDPLARYLFDHEIQGGQRVVINSIRGEVQPYYLDCTVS